MDTVEILVTKCDKCNHKEICKYVNEMTQIQRDVYSIEKTTESPISIDTDCSAYEWKLQ
jgi:hypothetical protein